jgi:DNA primase
MWLNQILDYLTLTEEVADYLFSRGAREESFLDMGVKTWRTLEFPIEDADFKRQFGAYGEKIDGCLVCPFYSPRGEVVGFEARDIHQKWISDFRIMPKSRWLPMFLGTRRALPKLWAGGSVWIVEGLFDLFALEWVVPEADGILATVRAKLSWNHLSFLQRLNPPVTYMVYDEDDPGRKGSEVGLKDLKRRDLFGHRIRYRGGKDPGEIWDRGGLKGLSQAFTVR